MKKSRLSLWISLTVVTVVGGIAFVATSRAGYETASYEVVKKDGTFEVRDYAAMMVVTTTMKGGEQNGSFGRLFKYISGGNSSEQKIAMTTPVFMPASGDGTPGEMQFVVPADVAKAGAPAPADPSVKLSRMSGGKYAAIQYSGVSTPEDRAAKLVELREWIRKEGLEAAGDPVYAGYDPPWTPGPMRRNEVLLKLK
jgi:effector-binding domain-containing protein